MASSRLRWWLCLLLCCLPWLASAADVRAVLDRGSVQLGETVTLNLKVSGGSVGTPDLSVLENDFEVLGTSSNSSLSIVNGKRTSEFTYGIALRPKHVGRLTIPAIALAGGSTEPVQLEVTAPDQQAAAAAGKDVFVEAVAEPRSAYVGQQMSFVVRLFFAASLSNGAMDEPQADGAELSKLGDEGNYQAERGGRRYNVIERRYALIPQHAGHIQVGPVSFQGELIDMADPNSFFGSTRAMSAASAPVSIDVRAVPAAAGKTAWLPARALSLAMEAPPESTQLRAGQPLNLTMTVQATGLPYESLPALSLPQIDGATVYPDKPVNGTRVDGVWLSGRRQQSFAVVPGKPGELVIPATTLTWWNTQTDKAEVATIPEHRYTVLPAVGAPATAASAAAPEATEAPVAATTSAGATPWRWIALGSIGLWLATLLSWWALRRAKPAQRKPAAEAPASDRQRRAAFLAAARGNDAAAQAHSLLAWAQTERPGLANLGALAVALASAPQREAIAVLQKRLYATDGAALSGEALAAAFRDGFQWHTAAPPPADPSGLPPLYPFKLD
ncbi:BatD family protein [Dyella sp. LX-66]|uniref:BatD family protein n=1 Tax=unclassified Dyella TaxID=2634549 RepID=UPI001BE078A8|nr:MULTISPECIES: BatD family protein [unclassified Dyella]MBT2115718.1 BatD family protein [Dyella sp. LX-1]MBT2139533.1 BatD family protein [Dyella sp. LX-66]